MVFAEVAEDDGTVDRVTDSVRFDVDSAVVGSGACPPGHLSGKASTLYQPTPVEVQSFPASFPVTVQ